MPASKGPIKHKKPCPSQHSPEGSQRHTSGDTTYGHRAPTAITLKRESTLNVKEYLLSAGILRRIVNVRKGQLIFRKMTLATVFYKSQSGNAKLSVVSSHGKEAIVHWWGQAIFLAQES